MKKLTAKHIGEHHPSKPPCGNLSCTVCNSHKDNFHSQPLQVEESWESDLLEKLHIWYGVDTASILFKPLFPLISNIRQQALADYKKGLAEKIGEMQEGHELNESDIHSLIIDTKNLAREDIINLINKD